MADLRGARTRGLFRDAMLELLDERPFEKLTVKTVCECAQLSKKAFYNHYTGLTELLVDCCLHASPYTSKPYRPLEDYTSIEDAYLDLLDVVANYLHFLQEHPNLAKTSVLNLGISPYFESGFLKDMRVLTDYILDRFAAKERGPITHEQLALYAMSGQNGVIRRWVTDGMVEPIDDVARALVALNLHTCAFMAGRSLSPEHLELVRNWQRSE